MTQPLHKRILQHFDISEQGLRELEIWLEKNQEPNWGPWVYVGTAPTDQNITHLSPPFQNNWRNAGNGLQRLRFRRTMPTNLKKKQSLEIEGSVLNGGAVTDSVVFTLPKGYRPTEASGPVVAANTDDEVVIWDVATNGDVTYVGPTAGGFSTDAIRFDVANVGNALSIDTTAGDGLNFETSDFNVTVTGSLFFLLAFAIIQMQTSPLRIQDFSLLDISGDQVSFDLTGAFGVSSGGSLSLAASGNASITATGDVQAQPLNAGGKFEVLDHLGNPIMTLTG